MKRRMKPKFNNKQASKLYDENWNLCKEIVTLRDKKKCILERGECEGVLQLDHCISRGCKNTFFETDILNWICQKHHAHKSFRHGQWVDLEVQDITKRRVGFQRWEELKLKSTRTCQFTTVWHQEQEKIRLREELALLSIREYER